MACLRGVGVASEPIRWNADDECMGVGLAEAVREAAVGLPRDTQIDRIICDINGERYRAQEWGMAVMKTQPLFRDPTGYESAAAAWGDVGAATGALSAILAVCGWVRGYAQPPHALLFAGSDGGLRAAALLERADTRAAA
jgi:3-oxoacyl-[acyl-carrier-protein] synthase-1